MPQSDRNDIILHNLPLLDALQPSVSRAAKDALTAAAQAGYDRLLVLEGLRSFARQARLYGQGRTRAQLKRAGIPVELAQPHLSVVTFAKPGASKHQSGHALDIGIEAYPADHWAVIARFFTQRGFIWGGNWKIKDFRHFEHRG